jgi:hypothetical protein
VKINGETHLFRPAPESSHLSARTERPKGPA